MHRHEFKNVKNFCMFVGYPRSGHSLIGSLLDAHPHAIIGQELDALRFLEAGFGKLQIWYMLLENSRAFAEAGRNWKGYSYRVQNQWQGKYSCLKLIGDKKGGETSRHLIRNPKLLEKLRREIGTTPKFVHIIRNPFDNITTMHLKNQLSLKDTIDVYFSMSSAVDKLKMNLDIEILDIYYEAFIKDPYRWLETLCGFLGLDVSEEYLRDCAEIIYDSPRKSRKKIEWNQESIDLVNANMKKFSFLDGYSIWN